MRTMSRKGRYLERLLSEAKRHGQESDPDHEVGDLQDILRECWERLSEAQAKTVFEKFDSARKGKGQ